MIVLDEIVKDAFGPEHIKLKELLKFMLRIDPN
jgi:hypothetical protein